MKKTGFVKTIAILILLLILAAGGIRVIKKKKEALHKTPPPSRLSVLVRAVKPEPGVFPVMQKYLGTIKAKISAEIAPRISGRIFEVRVREGQEVKQGELLAVIDDRQIQDKIDEIKARLAAAQTSYRTKQGIFQRDKALFKAKAISRERLDISKANHDAARAEVAALKAALGAQKTELTYARLYAPFDGLVTRRFQDPGDLALSGRPVLSLEKPSAGYLVKVKVPQAEIPLLKKGAGVLIGLEGRAGLPAPASENTWIKASISRVYPAIAAGTLGAVEIDLDQRPFGLPTGATVTAVIEMGHVKGLRIPVRGLLENVDSVYVYLVDKENKVHIKKTKPLYKERDWAIVPEGSIPFGFNVIVAQESALLRLNQDEKVTVVSPRGDI